MGVSGFTWAADEDLDGNVGMLDCLAAAEWTAKYIHKFGGHGKRITAIGQSAGAGIIYYLTVLNGGRGKPLPFQQAFISSPAAPQRRNVTARQRKMFDMVLEAANCTSLACLRAAPETTMLHVNDRLIIQTPTESGGGTLGPVMGFGPAPDGKLIPDIPSALIKQGRVHKDLSRLVVGSMALEGKETSHDVGMPGYFPTMVRQQMPAASNETVQALLDLYYRPGMEKQLAWDFTTDAVFACNAYNLANGLPDKTMRYIMSTPPAVHGQDLLCKCAPGKRASFELVNSQTNRSHPCRLLLRRRGADASQRPGAGARVPDEAAGAGARRGPGVAGVRRGQAHVQRDGTV